MDRAMRIYGRTPVDPRNPKGPFKWLVVETTPAGLNDDVYIVALAQTLKLNVNESPFWGNYGIPAHQSIMRQIMPDFYILQAQQFYSRFFASLIVTKIPNQPQPALNDLQAVNVPAPIYRFSVITNYGFKYPPIHVRGAPQ
jgi:hypothetical protein